jgi:hypothetical protein
VREGDVLVGCREAVGVDALGGGKAKALAYGGDLAHLFLALLKQISLEVTFKLGQCGGSLFLDTCEASVYRPVAVRLGWVVRFGDGR